MFILYRSWNKSNGISPTISWQEGWLYVDFKAVSLQTFMYLMMTKLFFYNACDIADISDAPDKPIFLMRRQTRCEFDSIVWIRESSDEWDG
jgi:hypothetical protein